LIDNSEFNGRFRRVLGLPMFANCSCDEAHAGRKCRGAGARHARPPHPERYAALRLPRIRTNAECDGALLEEIAAPDRSGLTLLRDAADALFAQRPRLSPDAARRPHARRVARIHIAEALSYRGETLRRAQEAA
jgi:magnesium chelatase family protein